MQVLADIRREAIAEAVTLDQLRANNVSLESRLAGQSKARPEVPESDVKRRISAAAGEAERKTVLK